MSKDYKKKSGKGWGIQDRLKHKGIFCISNQWIVWAKRWLNREERRKCKREIKESINKQ